MNAVSPIVLMVLAAAADVPARVAVPLVDGGICTGLAWVPVPAGAKITKTEGPDFDVIYVDGTNGGDFGVYIGGHPMASADSVKPLIEADGIMVRPSHYGAKFQGYIVSSGAYLRNHFFGDVFKDGPADLAFFQRGAIGKAADPKCKPTSGSGK